MKKNSFCFTFALFPHCLWKKSRYKDMEELLDRADSMLFNP